jgi:hypothetical protein
MGMPPKQINAPMATVEAAFWHSDSYSESTNRFSWPVVLLHSSIMADCEVVVEYPPAIIIPPTINMINPIITTIFFIFQSTPSHNNIIVC